MISHLSGHPVFSPPTVAGATCRVSPSTDLRSRVDRFVGTLLGKGSDGSKISVEPGEIVVIQGHDGIGEILAAAAIPYTETSRLFLAEELLEGAKLVFVNCHHSFAPRIAERLAGWVIQKGGILSTSDHGLRLLEKGFQDVEKRPLFVRHHNDIHAQAGDFDSPLDVCDIDHNDPFTDLFFQKGETARWTIQDGNWPVQIVDPSRVKVLARSPAFGRRYDGKDALMLRFDCGSRGGRVYHVVGHWKDQILGIPPETAQKSASSIWHSRVRKKRP